VVAETERKRGGERKEKVKVERKGNSSRSSRRCQGARGRDRRRLGMVSGIKIQAFSGSYVYAGRDKGPVRKSRKDPSVKKETSLVKKEGRGPGQPRTGGRRGTRTGPVAVRGRECAVTIVHHRRYLRHSTVNQ